MTLAGCYLSDAAASLCSTFDVRCSTTGQDLYENSTNQFSSAARTDNLLHFVVCARLCLCIKHRTSNIEQHYKGRRYE